MFRSIAEVNQHQTLNRVASRTMHSMVFECTPCNSNAVNISMNQLLTYYLYIDFVFVFVKAFKVIRSLHTMVKEAKKTLLSLQRELLGLPFILMLHNLVNFKKSFIFAFE